MRTSSATAAQTLGRKLDHTRERKKSLADNPLANRAVPPVGSTCDGPAT